MKIIRFVIVSLWIILTRIYDAYSTYQLTPDLSKEANPLSSLLWMNWTLLLVTIWLLMIYVLYAYYLVLFKPKSLLPAEQWYSFSNIVAYTYFGKKDYWFAMLYKLPRDINRLTYYVGNILIKGLVFVGFLSTIMRLLIHYTDFYKKIHSATIVYTIMMIGMIIIIYMRNKNQYKIYLNQTKIN